MCRVEKATGPICRNGPRAADRAPPQRGRFGRHKLYLSPFRRMEIAREFSARRFSDSLRPVRPDGRRQPHWPTCPRRFGFSPKTSAMAWRNWCSRWSSCSANCWNARHCAASTPARSPRERSSGWERPFFGWRKKSTDSKSILASPMKTSTSTSAHSESCVSRKGKG